MITAIRKMDDTVLKFIQTNLRFPILDKIMPFISWTGNDGAIWILIAALLLLSKRHREVGFMMIVTLVLCVLIGNLTLKPLVARLRPCASYKNIDLLIPRPKDFSFPSGHTMSSFAAATILFMADKNWGVWGLVLAALIAYSRLYLYVHYPSDIICGMLFGVLAAFVTIKLVIVLIKCGYQKFYFIKLCGG